jgi:hypothetical protein
MHVQCGIIAMKCCAHISLPGLCGRNVEVMAKGVDSGIGRKVGDEMQGKPYREKTVSTSERRRCGVTR